MKLHVHILYEVVTGDTLLKVARKMGMTLTELININNGRVDTIYPGNLLLVRKMKG